MRTHGRVVSLLLLLLAGCATITPYRGDHTLVRTLDMPPAQVFRAITEHALDNSLTLESASTDLGLVRARYDFPNAQTFRAASRAVSPFAEPMAQAINPYGQNPYVKLTIRILPLNAGQTELKVISRFESYGVPGGVGGIGPFQMNSKGIWEANYVDQVAAVSAELINRGDLGASRAGPAPKVAGSTGTGFFVSRDGHILTNAHVVDECEELVVSLPDGLAVNGLVVARDEQNDLAAVKLAKAPARWARFRSGVVTRAGDEAVAFGFPLSGALASGGNVTTGTISALAGLRNDTRYYQISVPVQPGNSGGPLLDASGNVIGVITSKLNALQVARITGDIPQNVNFALKATLAQAFLSSNGIAFDSDAGESGLTSADVGERAKGFSVRLDCFR